MSPTLKGSIANYGGGRITSGTQAGSVGWLAATGQAQMLSHQRSVRQTVTIYQMIKSSKKILLRILGTIGRGALLRNRDIGAFKCIIM
jgi:hypothetical protein